MKKKLTKTDTLYLSRVVNTLAVNRACFKDPRLTNDESRIRDFEGRGLVAQVLDVPMTDLGLALDDLNAELAHLSWLGDANTLASAGARALYVADRFAYWASR